MRYSTKSNTRSSTTTSMATAVMAREHDNQQADRAADRGDRAVPRVLRNARQKRADRGAQLQDRSVQPLEFLPGQEHPHAPRRIVAAEADEDRSACGADDAQQGRDDQADRRMDQDRGALPIRAGSRGGKGEGTRRTGARAPKKQSTSATLRWRSTTTTRWLRRRSRSASCWRRRPSSPAWSR